MKKYLCIDGGGTYVKYAVIDENETFLARGRVPMLMKSTDAMLDAIESIYRTYEDADGIAMALPGIIDETGYMKTGGSLQFLDNTDFANLVSRRCGGIPVTLENDAKAAATAELWSGALKGAESGMVITVGTALGGTLILDRKVVRGKNLFAGEISYLYYSSEHMFEDPPANEFMSSTCKKTFWAFRCGPSRICEEYEKLTGEHVEVRESEKIFRLAEEKDPNALEAIRITCSDLAMLLYNLQCTFDPEVIAIGGGVSEQPIFLNTIRSELLTYIRTSLPGVPPVNVVPCKYRVDANLLGAYYYHREHVPVKEEKSA